MDITAPDQIAITIQSIKQLIDFKNNELSVLKEKLDELLAIQNNKLI